MSCIWKVLAASASMIEPTRDAEKSWAVHLNETADMTLFPLANSWYMGDNVPGKPRMPVLYLGGFNTYIREVDDVLTRDFAGFEFA